MGLSSKEQRELTAEASEHDRVVLEVVQRGDPHYRPSG